MDRRIIHIDMDAFYASVEQRDNPELRGKPVIVGGHPTQRGVVAAASYEARKFGIHSAMPTSRAMRLCPQVILVRGQMSRYREISREIRAILYSFTPLVEPLSFDEAFLDVTACLEKYGTGAKIGKEIKTRIGEITQLSCSVGVAPNKFVAKIASDLKKPDGFVVVRPEKVDEFLKDLPVSRIWGVGDATEARLHEMQVQTIADLQKIELHELIRKFGKWGARLFELSRGIDERPVSPERETKSISRETTFSKDISDFEQLQELISELARDVAAELHHEKLMARTVQIKARYADFTTISRSFTFKEPMDHSTLITEASKALLQHRVSTDLRGFRLLGVGVTNLESGESLQLSLFSELSADAEKDLTRQLNEIKDHFSRDLTASSS